MGLFLYLLLSLILLLVIVNQLKLLLIELANHLLVPALYLIVASNDVREYKRVPIVTHHKADLIKVITAPYLRHHDLLVNRVDALIYALRAATFLLLLHERNTNIKDYLLIFIV